MQRTVSLSEAFCYESMKRSVGTGLSRVTGFVAAVTTKRLVLLPAFEEPFHRPLHRQLPGAADVLLLHRPPRRAQDRLRLLLGGCHVTVQRRRRRSAMNVRLGHHCRSVSVGLLTSLSCGLSLLLSSPGSQRRREEQREGGENEGCEMITAGVMEEEGHRCPPFIPAS
jgi:hypothetical protein